MCRHCSVFDDLIQYYRSPVKLVTTIILILEVKPMDKETRQHASGLLAYTWRRQEPNTVLLKSPGCASVTKLHPRHVFLKEWEQVL